MYVNTDCIPNLTTSTRIQDSGILYLAHWPHKLIQMCIQINIKSDGNEPWAGRLPLRLIYQSLSWKPPYRKRK